MSLAGLKKQFNKANQYVSERVGTAEATKLDDEYVTMERKVDVLNELVEDLVVKTNEYLQPNPATRAKMVTMQTISKIRGSAKTMPYPQPEGTLGESMLHHAIRLGDESGLGKALTECGEAYKQMADIKYSLEDNVRQNFLDPLVLLQNKELKDVNFHRKKLQGRRLDYDCKRRGKATSDELQTAEEKLEESKQLAESAMYNVLENDVEQISQLCSFVSAQLEFHRRTQDILEGLENTLRQEVVECSRQSRKEHIPKPVLDGVKRRSPRSISPSSSTGTYGGGGTTGEYSFHQSLKSDGGDFGSMSISSSSAIQPASIGNHHSGAPQSQDPWSGAEAADPWSAAEVNTSPGSDTSRAANGVSSGKQAYAKALYDFESLNEGELGLKEGQIVHLISQIDDNWFEGRIPGGIAGYFPINYVQVVVPLS